MVMCDAYCACGRWYVVNLSAAMQGGDEQHRVAFLQGRIQRATAHKHVKHETTAGSSMAQHGMALQMARHDTAEHSKA